ncbi:hypothetical protein Bca4012_039749 [Brassica carinata]|uniref:BAG family molecular chaperone regulator 8, chloroplastic n=1 Tax=Brassica carinata TaxID=52824 RepID=A0A8X7W791_BRACI|nr:hypothetical protein Bca52824_007987 [Brassica carinata]
MASHHHHLDCDCLRLHHHESSPHTPAHYTKTPPCFSAYSSPRCTQSSPPNLDHLLRLIIASHLQNQQQTQPRRETASTRSDAAKRHRFVDQENAQREYDNLLRKINDLDLSLDRFSSPARRGSRSTVKDSAARVIQTRFRSYLVRRSVSLRELKELTRIESSFVSLRSSVSGKNRFPLGAVSREAARLLLRLDSVKGSADSMVRDGKRRLCRDLVRFLHDVDDCAVRRRNGVSFGGKCRVGEDRSREKLKKDVRRIYVSSDGDEEENIAELEEFRFVSDDGQEIPIVSVGKSRKLGGLKPGVESVKGYKVKTPFYEVTSSAEDDDDSFDNGEEILMMSGDSGNGSSSRSRIGVVKNVSFNENGNVYKVYGDTPEASEGSTSGSNNESGDGYSEVENIKYVPKENDGFEESLSENEEESSSSSQGSKEEVQVSGNVSHTGRNENKREVHLGKGSLMFSPPLPLKMEP